VAIANGYIKLRISSSAEWSDADPILLKGEKGIESDTLKEKVGDGITPWNTLGYQIGKVVPENAIFTDTTYSVGDGGLTEINFTTDRKNKLDGIEAGAEVNDINTTLQGNTFNGVEQLVKTDADGKLPAIDASLLTNFPLTDISTKLDKTNPAIVGSITETVYNLTGTLINPSNGTIQYKTLSANTTFTESLTTGQSVTLRIAGGDTFTVAYPTITWVGGTAPVLTANDVIVFWKESTVLYGAYIGSLV